MITDGIRKTKFRDLLIAAIIVLILRGFTSTCEPLFFCSGVMAAIIAAQWTGIRRAAGIAILLVSCVGLCCDIRERIQDNQSIAAKSLRILEIHRQDGK